ncbi:BnaC06g14620D [Brassica napus]|uniref:(rape) hypothetical protein n=1 Tax=Brassica napus TaxID=3708 RepID=A0A078FFW8_BRANA|nr:uncharacterized protein BNAC06G14620D [Brassica napus]CAF2058425.1 unnamed protein product [Brassica napus]CDY13295.1 BnaC06g14620D [Brassica napus]
MTTILSAFSKLRGCVNQIENKNPSGASEQDILNQAKMLLMQDVKYSRGFKFDHVWPILKGIENFANNNTNASRTFQEGGRNVTSSPSFSIDLESSPSPGMNSFDLNMNSEETTSSLSPRPMGMKKTKKKLQSEEQFKQMMEQNDKLIKAITKGTSERNEIQRQKVKVAKMNEENKILFTDLSSITDPACRMYIENERKRILKKRTQTNQPEEHGEDSQYQNHGSQYQESQVQGEQVTSEDQISPNDLEVSTPYSNYFNGMNNNFPNY